MPRHKTESVHLKVTPETKDVLERAASRRRISLSELMRTGAKLFTFEELARDDPPEGEANGE